MEKINIAELLLQFIGLKLERVDFSEINGEG